MARLNTHLSATPQFQSARSGTVDSLYRDPSLPPTQPRESSYSVLSPRSANSDKENEQPGSTEGTPRHLAKGKRPMAPPGARMPTPSSGSSSEHANKRRRTNGYSGVGSSQIYEDEDADNGAHVEDEGEEEEEEEEEQPQDNRVLDLDEEDKRFYDPQQDPEFRRQLRAGIRNHQRQMEGTYFPILTRLCANGLRCP